MNCGRGEVKESFDRQIWFNDTEDNAQSTVLISWSFIYVQLQEKWREKSFLLKEKCTKFDCRKLAWITAVEEERMCVTTWPSFPLFGGMGTLSHWPPEPNGGIILLRCLHNCSFILLKTGKTLEKTKERRFLLGNVQGQVRMWLVYGRSCPWQELVLDDWNWYLRSLPTHTIPWFCGIKYLDHFGLISLIFLLHLLLP